jgi:hypothetical protein
MKFARHQFSSVRVIVGFFLLVALMGWSALGAAPSPTSSSTSTSAPSPTSTTSSTSTQTGPNLNGLGSIFSSISSEVCTDVFPCSRCQPTITGTNSTQTITITNTTTVTGSPVTSTISTTIFTTVATNQTTTLVNTTTLSSFTTFLPVAIGDCSDSVGGSDTTTTDFVIAFGEGGPSASVEYQQTCTALSLI